MEGIRTKFADVQAQEEVVIGIEDVSKGIRRMANWKAPGPDGVRGFCFKKTPISALCIEGCVAGMCG